MKKQILLLLLLVLTLDVVSGFGIAPSSKELLLDEDHEFNIHVINRERESMDLEIIVDGPLKDHITLSEENIKFHAGEERATVNVKVEYSEEIERGLQETRIRFRKAQEQRGQVSANIDLSFVLRTIKPYDKAFINVELQAPNFERKKQNTFIIKTSNQGLENAINVIPVIDIYTRTNEKIDTITLDPVLIRSRESRDFSVTYSPDFANGEYYAEASVIYEGDKNKDMKSFKVGTPEINVDRISTSQFRLGGIANFNILVKSEWGRDITDVYAEVDFKKENELLETTRSYNARIPAYDRTTLPIYWDTTNLGVGMYQMEITLNYLDQQKKEVHNIEMTREDLRIVGTGQVIGARTEDEFDYTVLLFLAIFLLVATNSYLMYYMMKKRKK